MGPLTRRLAFTFTLLLPLAAQAGHTDEPDVDYLAETLDKWDVRLSLTRLDVGVWKNIQLGTYTLPWLFRGKNLHARATFYQDETWAAALQLGILAFNPRDLNEDFEADVDFRIIPAKLQLTWTRNADERATVGIGWAQTLTDYAPGSSDDDEESEAVKNLEATLGASTGRLELAYEYRLSDFTALSAESQIMLFQRFGQGADAVITVDERTTVEIHEKAGAEDEGGFKGNIGGAVTWAWDTVHLKLGLYYGHYVVPLVGAFVPNPIFMPELDLSWRW